MLLTITTTHKPATDLGYLLHKNPFRCQSFEFSFGKVHVFYPEASEEKCTVAMLLDVDPVGLVRGNHSKPGFSLEQYVNDRPYVASSFLSVAIAQVFGTALKGACKDRPELEKSAMPLSARIAVLPCWSGEQFIHRLFQPLGYEVHTCRHSLDEKFPEWGASPYYTVCLEKETTVSELLKHLYVLIPVLDNQKHYYVDSAEIEKLITHGEGWLTLHPEREAIAKRYLKYTRSLTKAALARLDEDNPVEIEPDDGFNHLSGTDIEIRTTLDQERLGTALAVLRSSGARKVIDLGCGEGKFLAMLLADRQFEKIIGMDVSVLALERAQEKLRMSDLPPMQRSRIELIHGSLLYRDRRFEGYDAATVIEVIEHMDAPRLAAFERVLFEFAKPKMVVITTPNREYNVMWTNLAGSEVRHSDHRFEWTRNEFQVWAEGIAEKFGYEVRFLAVGQEDKTLGSPTQMAVFETSRRLGDSTANT